MRQQRLGGLLQAPLRKYSIGAPPAKRLTPILVEERASHSHSALISAFASSRCAANFWFASSRCALISAICSANR